MINHTDWFRGLASIIESLEITCGHEEISVNDGYDQLLDRTAQIRAGGKHVFLIGNGASASMASHIAADLCKNGKVKTEVFTDLALITALVNDVGVERMFAEALLQQGSKGDMLVAISSSGKSANILKAVSTAKAMGIFVVTLSAMGEDNPLRGEGNLNFYLPAATFGFAESGHAALLHYWVDAAVAQM